MTLDEIVRNNMARMEPEDLRPSEVIKKACIEYAESVVPELKHDDVYCGDMRRDTGYKECIDDIRARINQDKLTNENNITEEEYDAIQAEAGGDYEREQTN